jgi:hypothetical protein
MSSLLPKASSVSPYFQGGSTQREKAAFHSSSEEKPNKRPANRVVVKPKFTPEAKAALLQALQTHSWTTAREAYGWAWNQLGLRVTYLTVWRFLTAQGLLVGDTPRARRLALRLPSCSNLPGKK